MLSLNDVLDVYKSKLTESMSGLNEIIDNITTYGDNLADIVDIDNSIAYFEFDDVTDSRNEAILACRKAGEAIYNCFNNTTLIDSEGNVKAITVSHTQDYDTGAMYFNEILVSEWNIDDNGVSDFYFDNAEGDFTTVGNMIDNIVASAGSTSVIQTAIQLAEKGELTLANFSTSVSDITRGANDSVKTTINVIKDSINSSSQYSQLASLVNALKILHGGVYSASANDNDMKISFASTDYTVSTSFFLPMNTLINLASTVLSGVISLISPIFGLITYTVGQLVSSAVEAITENDSSDYKILNQYERDNDCFGIPIIQRVISTEYLPSAFKNHIIEHGFCKMTNGFATIYSWPENSIPVSGDFNVCVEAYMNAKSDVTYCTPDVNDGLLKLLNSLVSWSTQQGPTTFKSGLTMSGISSNIDYWLNDNATPGGDAPYIDAFSGYGPVQQYNLCYRRLVYMFLLFTSFYVAVDGKSGTVINNYGPSSTISRKSMSDLEILACICSKLCWDINYGDVSDVIDDSKHTNNISIIINDGIPILRKLLSETISNSKFNQILDEFSYGYSTYTDSLRDTGCSDVFIMTSSVANKTNGYVYPPNSTINIWTKVAITTLAITTIAITAIIVKTKVKRRISYKANLRRKEIARLKEVADTTGTYSDYVKAYKANRRYNMIYGRLTGSIYDMNNAWIESRSSFDGSLETVKQITIPTGTSGQSAVVAFDPTLYKLITGQDI